MVEVLGVSTVLLICCEIRGIDKNRVLRVVSVMSIILSVSVIGIEGRVLNMLEGVELVGVILVYVLINLSIERYKREWGVILFLSGIGIIVTIFSKDLLMLYLGIELQSLGMYMLLVKNRNKYSTEGGMKYLIMSCIGSGLVILGGSKIYGIIGSINLNDIEVMMSYVEIEKIHMYVIIIGIGLIIKVGIVPVVDWIINVIEGVEDENGRVLSTVSKVGYMIVMLKVYGEMGIYSNIIIDEMIRVLGVICLIVSSIGCYYQRRIKRFLGYSSVGHIGLMLLGIKDIECYVNYLVIYMIVSWCIWELVISEKWIYIEDLIGSKREELKRINIVVLMCILSGIPPFIGFYLKLGILESLIINECYKELVVCVLYIIISSYNYLRIVRIVYFDDIRERVVSKCNYIKVQYSNTKLIILISNLIAVMFLMI